MEPGQHNAFGMLWKIMEDPSLSSNQKQSSTKFIEFNLICVPQQFLSWTYDRDLSLEPKVIVKSMMETWHGDPGN